MSQSQQNQSPSQLGVSQETMREVEAAKKLLHPRIPVTKIVLLDKLLLLGPPGIGKTAIIRQKAEEEARYMGRVFIDVDDWLRSGRSLRELYEMVRQNPGRYYLYYRIVATHVSKEDVTFPVPDEALDAVRFLPAAIFKLFTLTDPACREGPEKCSVAGTIFVDELTNVQDPFALTLFYSMIQEKRVGWNITFPETVKIVAAGNRPEESSVAGALPAPLLNRLIVYEVSPPKVYEWIEYMESAYRDRYDRRVADFLLWVSVNSGDATPGIFVTTRMPPQTLEPFPTPRQWTNLALALKRLEELRRRGRITEEEYRRNLESLVYGTVGGTAGSLFLQWLKALRDIPSIDAILENPAILAGRNPRTVLKALTLVTGVVYRKLLQAILEGREDPETLSELERLAQKYINVVKYVRDNRLVDDEQAVGMLVKILGDALQHLEKRARSKQLTGIYSVLERLRDEIGRLAGGTEILEKVAEKVRSALGGGT